VSRVFATGEEEAISSFTGAGITRWLAGTAFGIDCQEPSWLENIELCAKKAIKRGQPHSLWVSIDIWNRFVSTVVGR
jgi:hypothetical protein